MDAVEIDAFSYAYRQQTVPALQNITLRIPAGAFWGIIGPTGAGKTTLCRSIAGLIPHYFGGRLAGRVSVFGCNTASTPLNTLAAHVGVVLDDYESQLVALTVEEEIAFTLENRGLGRQEINTRLDAALATVGLTEKRHAPVAALSGGQKQRLVIAAALAARPSLLVLDEPSAALDPEGVATLYHLLRQMRQEHGITVVVADHRTEMLATNADQLVLLTEGQIAAAGTPWQVFQYMYTKGTYTAALPPLFILSKRLGITSLDEEQVAAKISHLLLAKKAGEPVACSA